MNAGHPNTNLILLKVILEHISFYMCVFRQKEEIFVWVRVCVCAYVRARECARVCVQKE